MPTSQASSEHSELMGTKRVKIKRSDGVVILSLPPPPKKMHFLWRSQGLEDAGRCPQTVPEPR